MSLRSFSFLRAESFFAGLFSRRENSGVGFYFNTFTF